MNDIFNGYGMGMHNLLFWLPQLFIFVIFCIVFVTLIYKIIRGIGRWNKNNHSPVLTVEAAIVAKRSDVSYHHHNGSDGSMAHTSSSTSYYATFEVESGDRMELGISGKEFGMLAEGDSGRLTFQGTRFLKFDRH